MRKLEFIICLLICVTNLQAQEDSIAVDSNYLEDQIYLSLTYNILTNKPTDISQNGFSGGISMGFIKDIPLNKQRNFGIAIGIGYAYNVYIQNLQIERINNTTFFEIAQDYKINRLEINSIELPIELRWRNSTPQKYKFWRVYGGAKVSYLASTRTKYNDLTETIITKNIPELNKFQYGLMVATGFGTWNLYVYYGLNPFFKESSIFNNEKLNIKDFNIGLKFYIM